MPEKTALVLSAGGMFGAYQAGVWQSLSRVFRPDIVVGTSAGALNAWVIAARGEPGELREYWLDPECSGLARIKPTFAPWRGVFDSAPLHHRIHRLWESHRPRITAGVTAVELPAVRARLFTNEEIGWKHLAASCAVLFGYEQIRIGGRIYTDGGLLGALPVWAAVRMGATRIVAVNVLERMPSRTVRLFVQSLRAVACASEPPVVGIQVATIAPSRPLGQLRDALFWNRETAENWIALGAEDGERFAAKLPANAP